MVAFIEESLMASAEKIPAFKLSDLIKLYVARLSALGVHFKTRVHSTRFKKILLSQFQDMSGVFQDIFLVFNHDVGEAIASSCSSGEL